ncbi:MAG: hypothetical protein RLZZ290_246 [Pseudomonadota bacterium]|jgi:hypothetical protein
MKRKTLPEKMQPERDASYSIKNLKGRIKPPVDPVSVEKMRKVVITRANEEVKSSGQSPRK